MEVAEQARDVTTNQKAAAVSSETESKSEPVVITAVSDNMSAPAAEGDSYETVGDITAKDPVMTVRDFPMRFDSASWVRHADRFRPSE